MALSSNDAGATNTSSDAVVVESDEDLDDVDDDNVQDLLAEEILAESKEIEEETENLAAAENGEDLGFPFLPPIMNIELIKVIKRSNYIIIGHYHFHRFVLFCSFKLLLCTKSSLC